MKKYQFLVFTLNNIYFYEKCDINTEFNIEKLKIILIDTYI